MTDQLLPYYQKELDFLRRTAGEFVQAHPGAAERLRLGPDSCDDPHIDRMIESFAYLTARIRQKLDDDFPELTHAMLSALYPHYLAPVPSMSIVEFTLDRGQATLAPGHEVPRHARIETEPVAGEPCLYRTAWPTRIWPIEVAGVTLGQTSFASGQERPFPNADAVLRVELACYSNDMTFGKFHLPALRFYLGGALEHAMELYELICNHSIGVTCAAVRSKEAPRRMPASSIRPVGFEADECLLPGTAQSFVGYRLLTEFFAFPQKHLFIDLVDLKPALAGLGSRIEICFHLSRSSAGLERSVSRESVRLGCTPIVNLFDRTAEPIRLTQTESEYRLVPDARRSSSIEVHSVGDVVATTPRGVVHTFQPFYSYRHGVSIDEARTFYYASRRPAAAVGGRTYGGTDLFLTFVDLDFSPATVPDQVVSVEALCLNRDLPARLPFGGGQPELHLIDAGPITRITCLTKPTATLRPHYEDGALWRLISHLSLNHLSIAQSQDAAEALREILRLYDFRSDHNTVSHIDGILDVQSRRIVRRVGGAAAGGLCTGLEVAVTFDEQKFTDKGLYLFASMLERFLGLYCNINSFAELVAKTKQGELRRWRPRAGEMVLL